MKGRMIDHFLLPLIFLTAIFFSCSGKGPQSIPANSRQMPAVHSKPPGSFQDSLIITNRSAVFYEPDSMQKEKIKTVTEERIFNSSMHEYYYQVRNAHIILKKEWPDVKIIDARHVRYLIFVKSNGEKEIIDLDQKDDAYGMFVFDTHKSPRQIEMTNVENQVPDYFSN